jgi:hypothetical protein
MLACFPVDGASFQAPDATIVDWGIAGVCFPKLLLARLCSDE